MVAFPIVVRYNDLTEVIRAAKHLRRSVWFDVFIDNQIYRIMIQRSTLGWRVEDEIGFTTESSPNRAVLQHLTTMCSRKEENEACI